MKTTKLHQGEYQVNHNGSQYLISTQGNEWGIYEVTGDTHTDSQWIEYVDTKREALATISTFNQPTRIK